MEATQKYVACINCGCDKIENQETGLCASCSHEFRKQQRAASKVKIVKPIKKVSDKRSKDLAKYEKLRKEYLSLYPVCEVTECNLKAVDIHHMCGRENDLLLNTDYFMSMCRGHHIYYTIHSAEAIAKGYSLKRT